MFLRILNKAEEALISILLVATTLLVFIDVVMRFGFNTGFIWSQELTLLMSAWFVLVGASYGLKMGSHIGMDAFVKLFPPLTRKIISGIACVIALIYCALIILGGWVYLNKVYRIGIELEDLPIPTWAAQSILIFGFAFLVIRLLIVLWTIVFGDADGFRHADEAQDSMHIVKELSKEEV